MLAGARVDDGRVDPPAQLLGRGRRAVVAPAQHRRERPSRSVEREQAVTEARRADRVHGRVSPPDHVADERDDLVRVVSAVRRLPQLVGRLAALVEDLGADGGRADVDGEDAGHASSARIAAVSPRACTTRGRSGASASVSWTSPRAPTMSVARSASSRRPLRQALDEYDRERAGHEGREGVDRCRQRSHRAGDRVRTVGAELRRERRARCCTGHARRRLRSRRSRSRRASR